MSFAEKHLRVVFELANGVFEGGSNKLTIDGLRTTCKITNVGGADQGQAEIRIYGMSLSQMLQLSNVGADYLKSYLNGITVFAGEDGGSMSLVFVGTIFTAFVDAQDPPNACLAVLASPGSYYKVQQTQPLSFSGDVDVAQAMNQLATAMGLYFENGGVTAHMAKRYFFGSPFDQAVQLAEAAGIVWSIDRDTLFIAPPGVPRSSDPVPISPETGMVGYPLFNQTQIIVRCLFNPRIQFQGKVAVKSSLVPATGTWLVGSIEYDLSCFMPGGPWFQTINCYTAGETVS